uniref:Uncharacterized protein LOC111106656 isoform X3 n=1 Tax=Crassostrea virginica TaxID=6565 RepID=A0A8B8B131_CRAVI|nr:uncharacterized protein LOC111106656 isoform X3 [Crassostrea virginica]XP_022297121.1 uncharacterized protein LOC111106656 isoform X3 [Crassostrea virginica]
MGLRGANMGGERCPTYNVVAQKLDSVECPKKRCPPYNYRSNEVNVEYSCRYTLDIESSTSVATDSTNTSPDNSFSPIFITIPLIIIVLILVASMFYIYRRKMSQHSDALSAESIKFINDDSETPVKEANFSFEKAKNYLEEKKCVVITGVQGTGKTYLAESLVSDMEEKRRKLKKMWISSFSQLLEEKSKPTKNVDSYILDDLFYELQLDSEFHETLTTVNYFMTNIAEKCIIITVPSYIWRKHNALFSKTGLNEVHIDLNERDHREKRFIMKLLMTQHCIKPEHASRLNDTETLLVGKSLFKTIGFPAVISWMCKKPHEVVFERMLVNPLQKMTEEIEELKQSPRIEECAKYVILSYLTFHDDILDIKNINTLLIHSLMEMFARGFQEKDLNRYVKNMVGEYLLEIKKGVYKIDLNIWSKLVFVSVAKENLRFAEENYKNSPRHIINVKDCPYDMDKAYPECFIKVNRVEKLS